MRIRTLASKNVIFMANYYLWKMLPGFCYLRNGWNWMDMLDHHSNPLDQGAAVLITCAGGTLHLTVGLHNVPVQIEKEERRRLCGRRPTGCSNAMIHKYRNTKTDKYKSTNKERKDMRQRMCSRQRMSAGSSPKVGWQYRIIMVMRSLWTINFSNLIWLAIKLWSCGTACSMLATSSHILLPLKWPIYDNWKS